MLHLRGSPCPEGPSKKEIIRLLKRYIVRELYKVLIRPKIRAAQENDLPWAA